MLIVGPDAGAQPALWSLRPLRIGVINIMPHAEAYEAHIVRPIDRAALPVELVWIRLLSHVYASSSPGNIRERYVPYDRARGQRPLDGVILTGAPVEELAFEDVRYWSELREILGDCRAQGAKVLGLCWGALALAGLLGIEKCVFPKKLFGVFDEIVLDPAHPVLGGSDDVFRCTQSRHAGIRSAELEAARDAGILQLLSHGVDTGYSVFESADRRFLMHLGHPEYEATRLATEWERDAALGRNDVDPPRNFDLSRPMNVWRSHCNDLFARWLLDTANARALLGRVERSLSPP